LRIQPAGGFAARDTGCADLIVVGRAATTNIDSTSATPTESLAITVDRVLKGRGGNSVKATLDLSQPGYAAIVSRQYGIFFLKTNALLCS
jgi:hypothetical protein